jgi:hypothetical protein
MREFEQLLGLFAAAVILAGGARRIGALEMAGEARQP